ncbi:amino acid permease [Propionibacterium australiense]|uniref:Amino acid permease n=1 Tax=Propionibacterium australiense TaxID=119981 RepID=A0A383SAQ1_9ACTN|nr:amino acid permease [Propionibacterium australiense]RLP06665.1 amino acid permease [Propionibacterium australiense]RLP06696.1 amino acid permease [Propionibacterium australiense]SYZ34296.1 Amino acid permease, conserved site [Propionibacterium australiense]VEH92167.1 D-serine/D-alanine/glycine transporter [Propionibacterium australiense]
MADTSPAPAPGTHTVDKGDVGYNKALKNRHLQMIAIGGSIGTGLFLGAGGRLAQGGPGLALAYAICGVFAFLMVRALGELAIRRPSSGAFVSYAREFLGEKGAYVTGWFFFLDWAVTVMADITAVALYLHYWSLFHPIPQWVLALIALALVFVLNMLSVKMFGEAEFWFALIKVAAIVLFMLIAIWAILVSAPVGEATAGFHNITENGGFFPEGIAPVFALTLGVIFAFGGTEMVGVAAGEAADASRILPKAINSMILRIFIFYVGSVILMALVLPYTAYSPNESPFVTFFTGIGIPHAGDIIQVVVLTAALSSLNAGLYSTGRTLRSMAVAGEAPGFAARLNKHQVPSGGIIITSALGLLGVALNAFLAEDAFEIVMNLAGIGIAGTWAMILVTHLSFLKKVRHGQEQRPAYRLPGAPFTNYLSLAFFIIVVASNLTSASGRWTLLLFAIVVAAMVIGWFAVRNNIRADLLDTMIAADEEG